MWISSLDFDGRTGTAFELFPSLLAGLTTGLGLGNDIPTGRTTGLGKGPTCASYLRRVINSFHFYFSMELIPLTQQLELIQFNELISLLFLWDRDDPWRVA